MQRLLSMSGLEDTQVKIPYISKVCLKTHFLQGIFDTSLFEFCMYLVFQICLAVKVIKM